MVTTTDTARRLAEMTDAAAFERIAAAVLRAANPLYANLSHPGVQPGGKTVKAPFDNVGWSHSAEETRFVCAAHTTEQKDLESKWLHDPATVKPRKPGGRPTKPAGDLIKGIAEIEKLRERRPGLAVTFALTTNRETSLALRVSVEEQALAAGINLDVWSVSRIAHFLDTDSIGQIIRRDCLGLPVKLVSRTLLLEMGKRSIQNHLPLTVAGDNIHRDGFNLGRNDTLVIGSSGMGKTTACATELEAHIEKGLAAIVLKTEFLVTATTIEAALEGELRRQEPELEAGAGGKALSLCTSDEPLLVLVEDVNRASNPERLLNKILSWTRTFGEAHANERHWRLVCPIWPQHLEVIEDQKRVLANMTVLRVDRYSVKEAIRAIQKRASALEIQIDEHRAMSIADRLGQDPLLIGLHDLISEEAASGVIQAYVEERLGMVARHMQRTKSEVFHALYQLLRSMLQQRTLTPQWSEVKSWIGDQDLIVLLRNIAADGSVMRMSYAGAADVLEFRHDRVLNSLFSRALVEVLRSDALPDYVTDPFFAEVVADAAVHVKLSRQELAKWMDATPTVAAYALRLASELGSSYTQIAAYALGEWLQPGGEVQGKTLANQRYAVAHILAETTDPHVPQLVARFPNDAYPHERLLAAAFRNGDLGAGLTLLSLYEIGVTVAGKQSLLALVKRMYGSTLIAAVDAFLRRRDLDEFRHLGRREGAIRLAGYLGDNSLAQAVQTCWDQDNDRNSRLRSYLFATARCCGSDPETTLGPVCDVWEALPEEPNGTTGQSIGRVAGDYLAWEFRSYAPLNAVHYLVKRANTSPKLGWPITSMLRTVDHPDAVEHVARYAAKSGFPATSFLRSDWERQSRDAGRCMSSESRERLLTIVHDEAEPADVRKHVFTFWDMTSDPADLKALRQIPRESLLYDRALWARARRYDRSVIPEMFRKIHENPEYWLPVSRYVWSDGLTEALSPVLDQVAEEQGEGYTNLEYAVAEALEYVEPSLLVSMLSHRWAKLMTRPLMVQTALISTAPGAASLAHAALSSSQNPRALLEHFVSSATIKSNGRFRLSNPAQLQNLRPYLDLFTNEEIIMLWEACTKNGWFDFRAEYLEPRMKNVSNRPILLPGDTMDTDDLDLALAGERVQYYHWFDRQVERGAAREDVLSTLLNWLSSHDEERALAMVSGIVSYAATRREFQLFEAAVGQQSIAAPCVRAARFAVFSRSLH